MNEVEISSFFSDLNIKRERYKPYSVKMCKKILYEFGHYEKIAKPSNKLTNVTTLCADKSYGEIFSEYNNFLLASSVKQRKILNSFSTLKKFMYFLNLNGIKLINLQTTDLDNFIDYCYDTVGNKASSIITYIPTIQNFLKWCAGAYESTPAKPIFFSKIKVSHFRNEAAKHREVSDGHAFKKNEYPILIIEFLKAFIPKNEQEFLCHSFWKLISSCPVRKSYTLNLEFDNCITPLLNEKNVLCLYSSIHDKARNKNGQFPILDSLGIETVKSLESRIRLNKDKFIPIYNDLGKKSFIHLFQFENINKILNENDIDSFKNNFIIPYVSERLGINANEITFSPHSFRHYLLTHIVQKTGNEAAAQAAAGHHDGKMIRQAYIKSKFAKNALIYRLIDKFENGDITGKFYFQIINKLTEIEKFDSNMLRDLEQDIDMETYINRYGKKTELGYCFETENSCKHYLKCWNCQFFMMKRKEIYGAINLLANLIIEFDEIKRLSNDFKIENTIAQNKLRAIVLIKERLSDLKYSEEEIQQMVIDMITNKEVNKS